MTRSFAKNTWKCIWYEVTLQLCGTPRTRHSKSAPIDLHDSHPQHRHYHAQPTAQAEDDVGVYAHVSRTQSGFPSDQGLTPAPAPTGHKTFGLAFSAQGRTELSSDFETSCAGFVAGLLFYDATYLPIQPPEIFFPLHTAATRKKKRVNMNG